MATVLVVDDHPSIIEGLRAILTSEFHVSRFAVATTAEVAVSQSAEQHWTLIITDLSLPGRSGPELVSELSRAAPMARILVHTVHSERQFGVRVLRAGAHGYVTKDRPLDEFIDAVRTLLAGKRYISSELAEELIDALDGSAQPHEVLSDRELQVLRLFGQGFSASEIAAQLHINSRTVSTYRARVIEKLRLHSTADLIKFAIEHQLT